MSMAVLSKTHEYIKRPIGNNLALPGIDIQEDAIIYSCVQTAGGAGADALPAGTVRGE
jgi:hypothetical protein